MFGDRKPAVGDRVWVRLEGTKGECEPALVEKVLLQDKFEVSV